MPWPDRRILDLFGIDLPIIQAPMAGITTPALISAVAREGGLGSLPLGMATPDEARAALDAIGEADGARDNLNFFCHRPTPDGPLRADAWHRRLVNYFEEMGLPKPTQQVEQHTSSFGGWHCELVERIRPKAVSFHFGLPERPLLERMRATGAKIICSATTVREARWLEAAGCDAIIAQGVPPYCLICRCYPDGAIADDDPMSIDRPRQVAFPARSTRGAVGGSGPT
jgi:nitronate monooxygenase